MIWRKSSRCGSNACVEIACDTGACVEVANTLTGAILVRDGKLGTDSPLLKFAPAEWDAFIDATKAGEFDMGVAQ